MAIPRVLNKRLLRRAFGTPRNDVLPLCHCEERSDVAISVGATLRPFVIARARQGPWQSPAVVSQSYGNSRSTEKERLLRRAFGTPRNDRGMEGLTSFLAMTPFSSVIARSEATWQSPVVRGAGGPTLSLQGPRKWPVAISVPWGTTK